MSTTTPEQLASFVQDAARRLNDIIEAAESFGVFVTVQVEQISTPRGQRPTVRVTTASAPDEQ